ncbi:hypothetical protein RR46_14159 [Papilio xuthus]|uniref:Uncharacterized protein n=1 Tax=Papilio xuthus TaxID=66420 RepID=A0A194PIR1_PAPXU|nr:hypothetical protein RR46_14159 [Papilio xuthus]
MGTDDLNTLLSVEFEVFGQVQGFLRAGGAQFEQAAVCS